MLKNNLKIAWRNLTKNKGYSAINIGGLALGMAVTLIIGLWINDELTYNRYFQQKNRIAQVFQSQTFNGNTGTGPAIPLPLEPALGNEYGDKFKHITMASWTQNHYIKLGEKSISRTGNYMQPNAVELLNLEITRGDKNGLKEINSIMISESLVEDFFGKEDPIGKILKISNQYDLMVTAVYKDIPVNNTFNDMDFLIPWDHYVANREWIRNSMDNWQNNSFQMFIQIADNTTFDAVTEAIIEVKKKADEDVVQYNPRIFLLPMDDWYLRSNFEDGVQTGGRITYVWLFGIIGIFVLILACINFMNLSTARSEKRAKEVGIRKTLGSQRGQLIAQFLSESFLVVIFAFISAVAIVLLFLNGFNDLARKEILFPWTNPSFWLISVGFIVVTALLAGSYPALYLSSFKPVQVLKGTFKGGKYSGLPRKILVVLQFTVSVAFIIGTFIVMQQINHAKNRPIGYEKEGLIQIPTFAQDFTGKTELMREKFIKSGAVVEMATSSSPTTQIWSNRSGYTWEGKPDGFQEDFAWTEVSVDYAKTLKMKVVEGRDFSRDFASDSLGILINETAKKYMGVENPVGMLLRDTDEEDPAPPLKIIGVVEDMVAQSPYEPVKQGMYVYDRYDNFSYYNLRLNPNQSAGQSIAVVERVFREQFPDIPFEYQFVDEEYGRKFSAEERVGSLAGIFTGLAILISCLGLFGLTSFVAEQRTKEIGVRKVLGASISQLWLLLSKDFITLVFISILVASPLAYYVMGQWLQKFTYRTSVGWEVFAVACIGALVITLITVSFQAVKAATANPVKSLRTE